MSTIITSCSLTRLLTRGLVVATPQTSWMHSLMYAFSFIKDVGLRIKVPGWRMYRLDVCLACNVICDGVHVWKLGLGVEGLGFRA